MFRLTLKSMLERKVTVFLCLCSIAFSTALYLGVSRLSTSAKEGFTGTLSGADLIVGAKGGELNLLLYSIFHLGNPTSNIRYESYQKWASNRRLAWTIPISLGDSYKGFRVVGTDQNFTQHYRYRSDQKVEMQSGEFASGIWGVALGSKVAKSLGHKLGDRLILSHGISETSLSHHDHTPFTVKGILAPTGTPIDSSVFITLQGMEAMHIGWESGIAKEEDLPNPDELKFEDIKIRQITSFIAGARNRIQVLHLRRAIDTDESEPLMAIIPGLALSQLWEILSGVELALRVIGICVLIVGVIGIVIALTTSLQSRRREMAILRSVGGAPRHILFLLLSEALILAIFGFFLGEILLILGLMVALPLIEGSYSMALGLKIFELSDLGYLGLTLSSALMLSLLPAFMAYKQSLRDGLSAGN